MKQASWKLLVFVWLVCGFSAVEAAEPLIVVSDFEGASVSGAEVDNTSRTIKFMPGGDPVRGWPCWWYFRVEWITPGETITLQLRGSTATVDKPGSPLQKPLASSGPCLTWENSPTHAFSSETT